MKKLYALLTLFCLTASALTAQITDIVTGVGSPAGIALEGNDLYIGDTQGQKIWKADISDETPMAVSVSSATNPNGMLVIGDYLYYTTYHISGGSVSRIDITQPNPAPELVVDNLIGSAALALKGNDLYIAEFDGNRISKIDITQPIPTTTEFVVTVNTPYGLDFMGNNLYVSSGFANKVVKLDISQPSPTVVDVATGFSFPSGLTVDGNFLYIAETSGGKISRVDLMEENPSPVEVVSGLSGPRLCAFDGIDLYICENTGGKISRLVINNPVISAITACSNETLDNLGGASPTGGVYSGPGVTDNGDGQTFTFDLAGQGLGTHMITYTISGASVNTTLEVVDPPTVSFTAPGPYFENAGAQTLSGGMPIGGTYSGNGVVDNGDGSYSFDPAVAGAGSIEITYDYTDGNGCMATANGSITVNQVLVGTAYITNAEDGTVSVMDIATGDVVHRIHVGGLPFGVAVAPDEERVYVTDVTGNRVAVINASTYEIETYVPVGATPFGIAVNMDNSKVFVADFNADVVSVINTSTFEVTTLPAGNRPYGVAAPSSNTDVFLTSDFSGNEVSVTSLSSGTIVNDYEVGLAPTGVALDPAATKLYVANYQTDNVSIIDGLSHVVTNVDAGDAPFGVVVNDENTKLYVSNQLSDNVSVIDIATHTLEATIPVGDAPYGVDITPDGSQLFVVNAGDNTVTVISTATNQVVATYQTEGHSSRGFGTFMSSRISTPPGASLNFDGSNDYVNLPDELKQAVAEDITVEAWFRAEDFTGERSIVHNLEWTANGQLYAGYALHTRTGNQISGTIATGNNQLTVLSVDGLNTGQWYHVAMTYDGSTVRLYLDGQEVNSAEVDGGPIDYSPLPLAFNIGRYYDTNEERFFQGDIDEVRIWDRALSCFEIDQQRNCELGGTENGLIAYYQFNQGASDGTNTDMDELNATTGPNGSFMNFALTGTTSNFIAEGAVTTGVSCGPVTTISFELKGNGIVIENGDDTPATEDRTDLGQVHLNETRTADFLITPDPNLEVTGVMSSNPAFTAELLEVDGQRDIRVSFSSGDLGVQTSVISMSTNDCSTGDFSFTVQATAGEEGAALDFDGVDDDVTVDLGTGALSEVSISGWVYPTNANAGDPDFDGLFGWRNNSNADFYLLQLSATQVEARFRNSAGTNFDIVDDNLELNTWQHYSLTYDGTTLTLYRNGEEVGSTAASGDFSGDGTFRMGMLPFNTNQYYLDGRLDDVRVYNKAISCFEAAQQYSCELIGSEDGLIAYYTMDQGLAGADNTAITELTALAGPNATLNNFALMGETGNFIAPGGVANGVTCGPVNSPTLVSVTGNEIVIPNGDTTPATEDGTDMGTVFIGESVSQDFKITADGALPLYSYTIDNPAFVLGAVNSQTGIFSVNYTPVTEGEETGVITLKVGDCTIDNTFTFTVTAQGTIEPGASLNFDGTDDYVSLPSELQTAVTQDLTVEAWFRADVFEGDESIVHNLEWTVPQSIWSGYGLMTRNNGRLSGVIITGENEFTLIEYEGLETGVWYHAAMTYDGETARLFLDGQEVASAEATGAIDYSPMPINYYIGRYHDVNEDYYFDGDIDEVRIWDRALSCTEVDEQRNCELDGNEDGLIAYYQFNQGAAGGNNTGISELEATTGPNGTLINFALMGESSNFEAEGGVVTGSTCGSFELPEFTVTNVSTGTEITDGDDTPSVEDGTDFGNVLVGTTVNVDFQFELTGDVTFVTASNTNGQFGVSLPGDNTVTVNFSPSESGSQTATIFLEYSDCSGTNEFSFVVQGNGFNPPANNECMDAEDISSLFGQEFDEPQTSGTYDNTNATTSDADPDFGWDCFGEPDGAGGDPSLDRTLWFSFIGDGNTYYITTVECDSEDYIDSGDTQMAVYSGDCEDLTAVGCNEDGPDASDGHFPAGLEFETQPGVTYWVMIDGFGPDFPADGEFCIEVTNKTPNSVTNIQETSISVTPNPTNGKIRIDQVEAIWVDVYDKLGRKVAQFDQPDNQIDITELPSGVYTLKIQAENEQLYSARVVKE